ncbi:hypothetical protein HMPREF0063_11902 [Aeromicrobium marinum DSM 15272]|uniref:Uncharacterized protein n=1 Tax=Aeromicrobium marinum DSM 15272 TaxID=585531 RepID=E2SDW6_9ACTN|nr:hypothetical protein HMPREF0063_11902 [Aeromicrobium marinum DSM 15272]
MCLIAVGILAFVETPASIEYAGIHGPLSAFWAVMIGGGAAASLYGVTTSRLGPEVWGCSFVGAGFAVWAVSALIQPAADITSVIVALVFLSGTAGQVYRVGMITEGRVLRD